MPDCDTPLPVPAEPGAALRRTAGWLLLPWRRWRAARARAPSGTAMAAARQRLAHMLVDGLPRVYQDPLLERVLGDEVTRSLADDASLKESKQLKARASMVVRQRFAEEVLAEAIVDGVDQFVVLGAGMDLFGARCGTLGSRLTVYELDRPPMQRFKRRRLAAAGVPVPDNLRFVPHDLNAAGMLRALRRSGFDPQRRALLAWLGVTSYITRDGITATLRAAAGLRPGSGIVFDYKLRPRDLDVADAADLEDYTRSSAREPWVSIFEEGEMAAALSAAGWRVVREVGAEEVMRTYLAGRSDGLIFPGYTRIVYAVN